MKHSKHIARIVAFALLAVTMIGSFIGCKNAAGGDGSEDLTGFYVWKPYPNAEGEQVNYYAQFTKSTLQIYEVTESGGKVSLYEKRLGKRADSQDASSWNLQSIPYTAKGGVLTISATSIHLMYEDKPYTGSYDANSITIPGIFVRSEEDTVTMTKTTDNFFNRIDSNPIFTPGVYVLDYNSSAVVLDFSETRTVQMYEIAKNETDDVVSWFPCFEPKGNFVAEKGKLTVTASTGVYEGQYSSTKVILPGKLTGTGDPSIYFVKTDDDYIAKFPKPSTLADGFYATQSFKDGDNIVRSYAEIKGNTIQIYKVTENEAGDVIAWNPVLGTRTGTEPNYTWTENAAEYTAVGEEQGVFSFTASIGSWKEDKNYKIYGGKECFATVNYADKMVNYTKTESFFDKLPETIADGFYITQGFKEGDNIVRSYAEIKDNTIQIYKVTESKTGGVIAWNPVLGTRKGTEPNYTWTEQAASYRKSDKNGIFLFTASTGSWKEDKNYKIYGVNGGFATVNPYDSTENYTKAESFFDKLPNTIADGFYATSGWENGDGGVSKDLAHFIDGTVQVYFLQEKADGTISVSSPALGTSQETKKYVPYTVEKGKITFSGIYCRGGDSPKDYYGSIGLDTVSLPGAFTGSGDPFREFTKTDKDYTDYLPTEQ